MVSFTLDAVKFLLIYRYLQNIYWFKRGFRKERRPDNRPACESRNPKRSLRGYFGAVTNGVSSSFFSVAGLSVVM